MPVLKPYRFAFERFAIALIGTLIFADLSPHTALSPEIVLTPLSKVQATNATETDVALPPAVRK